MADMTGGCAGACSCFWTGLALFYGFTSCYCYNEEKPEECAESQNKIVAELLLYCLHVTRNNAVLCTQAMTESLGDVAIWQPGRTEPGIKGRRFSLKDTTGCVLADLVLRAGNGMSALPIPAGRCPETQVADQTSKLCTLILKS